MKNMLRNIILLLVCGVFGKTGEVKTVNEGDSVTLHTNLTDIQRDEKILWRFGEAGSLKLIVQMIENAIKYLDFTDERFRDRLQILDSKTGSLTIKNMRIKHSGLYEAEISTDTGSTYKKFKITVKESPRVIDAGTDDVKTESVTEGDSLTLHTDVQTQRGDLILWRFGDKGVLIAKADKENNKTPLYDDDDEWRFKGRLQLDDQTGSLTITNSRTSDSGVYQLKIISSIREPKYKTFNVIVRERPLPSWAIAGICILVLSVIAAAAAAGVIFYRRMSELKKLWENMKTETVKEGHPLSLSTGVTDIQSDDVIQWRFGETLIAEINSKEKIPTDDADVQRFRDRLKLNDQTGDLIISDIRPEHAGRYKLKIITSGGTSESRFKIIVPERKIEARLGGSVTLESGVTEVQRDDEILWRFGAEDTETVKIIGTSEPVLCDYSKRFGGRLKVDSKTGSLTISDISPEDSGVYKAQITGRSGIRNLKYNVIISVSVMKGESVTLKAGDEIQSGDQIQWISEDYITLVTGEIGDSSKTKYTDDKSFRDRVKMYHQTGDLTITDTRQIDGGDYIMKFSRGGKISVRMFSVCVIGVYRYHHFNKLEEKPKEHLSDSAGIRGNDSVSVRIPLLNEAEHSF